MLRLATLAAIVRLVGVHAQTSQADILQLAQEQAANQYIVEFVQTTLAARDLEASLASHDHITVRRTFDSDVFRGASVEIADALAAEDLAAVPNVARVWRNEFVSLEASDTVEYFPDDAAAAAYDVFSASGVDRLHQEGILGQGVKVGVIDSGVDYTHPALGGGFGPGFKVAGGWDFVGNGLWPQVPKAPDSDPRDQQGHGTHVAGIVAGKSSAWSGVAPNATLYAYKVMGRLDVTDYETLIEALLRAYDDGMDAITVSISTPKNGGFSRIPWADVASRLVQKGVVVTIAAGNKGANGIFSIGDGASGKNVIAVGSLDSNTSAAAPFTLDFHLADGTSQSVVSGYVPEPAPWPSTIRDWPVIPMNFNTADPADGCTKYPEGTRNLTNTIPLVRRGTCTFATKLGNLGALGAQYVLVYNNEAPIINPSTDDATQTMGLITADAGKAIIDAVKAGGNVTAGFTLSPSSVVGQKNPFGGRPSTFSAWGPLYDLTPKPEIAAPGSLIFSTVLDSNFATMSGTSMATPYVAGVAALSISVNGGSGRSKRPASFAIDLRRKIITSGLAVPWSDGSQTDMGFGASVAQMGNGLVNAYRVVKYGTVLDAEPINLKDTRNFQGEQQLTVRNEGPNPVTYTLSLASLGGFEVFTDSKQVKKFDDLTPLSLEVDAQVPEPFTLQAGESKTVTVTFANPSTKGWNDTLLPIYSGKVLVSGDNGEQLSVPYIGMAADLQALMTPIWNTGYPFSKSGVDFADIKTKSYYTFNLSTAKQDFPKIFASIRYGSEQIRWDIFEAGWTEDRWSWPLTPGVNGFLGPVAEFSTATTYVPGRHNSTNVSPLPRTYGSPYGVSEFYWLGRFGNLTQIAPGNYTMRFAALNPFGNPKASSSWSIYKTPEIQVLPCPGCPDIGN